jgi:hypothetical protein
MNAKMIVAGILIGLAIGAGVLGYQATQPTAGEKLARDMGDVVEGIAPKQGEQIESEVAQDRFSRGLPYFLGGAVLLAGGVALMLRRN